MAKNLKTLLQSFIVNSGDLLRGLEDSARILDFHTARGENLDIIGGFVGIARFGLNDIAYRERILKKIELNTSYGSREDLINAIKFYINPSNIEIFEGSARVHINIFVPMNKDKIKELKKYIGAGILLYIIIIPDDPFAFFDSPDGLGFGDVNDSSVGGKFSYIFS